jgi:hypothetical protein
LAFVCEYEAAANTSRAVNETNSLFVWDMRGRLLPFFIKAIL